jgi:hypothetical protein
MDAEALRALKVGLTEFIPILNSLDFNDKSHKYQLDSAIQYWGIFSVAIENGLNNKDQDVIDLHDLHKAFLGSMHSCLTRAILKAEENSKGKKNNLKKKWIDLL